MHPRIRLALRVIGTYFLILLIYHSCRLSKGGDGREGGGEGEKKEQRSKLGSIGEIILHLPAVSGYFVVKQTWEFFKFVFYSLYHWRESLWTIYQKIARLGELAEIIQSFFAAVKLWLYELVRTWLIDPVTELVDRVTNWILESLYDIFIDPVVRFFARIRNGFRLVRDTIRGWLLSVIDRFFSPLWRRIHGVYEKISEKMNLIWTGFVGILEGIYYVLTAPWRFILAIRDGCSDLAYSFYVSCSTAMYDIYLLTEKNKSF